MCPDSRSLETRIQFSSHWRRIHFIFQKFVIVKTHNTANEISVDATQFVNQKAEAHWTFRTYLQENLVSRLADEETAAQLSTIRYRENSRGLTEIESKEARNQRGIPGSPDRAESLIMAFMKVVPRETTVVWGGPHPRGYEISPV